jgi:hypothetical protein
VAQTLNRNGDTGKCMTLAVTPCHTKKSVAGSGSWGCPDPKENSRMQGKNLCTKYPPVVTARCWDANRHSRTFPSKIFKINLRGNCCFLSQILQQSRRVFMLEKVILKGKHFRYLMILTHPHRRCMAFWLIVPTKQRALGLASPL